MEYTTVQLYCITLIILAFCKSHAKSYIRSLVTRPKF